VRRRRHEWELTYSTATHRALLLTYSNHLALPDDLREGLLDCIDALVDARYGGTVTKRYLAELVVAAAMSCAAPAGPTPDIVTRRSTCPKRPRSPRSSTGG
jgi:hypothetical protein